MNERKSHLVVKTNQLNTALQTLSLAEIRLIQLAIVDARETGTGLDSQTPLRIEATRFAEVFNTTRQNAYTRMKEAEETLFNRRFTCFDTDGKPIKSRWLQQVQYHDGDGFLDLVFTVAVVNGITRIDGLENFFTSYLLEQTTKLSSIYSVRLYELLAQWRTAKKTPQFELEVFRSQMGLGIDDYPRMTDFKRRVLEKAIKEINDTTDLTVSYKNIKKGRNITGFKFTVLEKKTKDKQLNSKSEFDNSKTSTIDGLSEKQLIRITRHKEFISLYGQLATGDVGRDWGKFSEFMANEIKKDPNRFSRKRPVKEYLDGQDEDYQYH